MTQLTSTPGEMVAKVAAAHWNAGADAFNQWDSLGADEREQQITQTRAAIAAMRTPNEAMVGAGRLRMPYGASDPVGSRIEAYEVWLGMIDAALQDDAA